jgi:hypothetical protein
LTDVKPEEKYEWINGTRTRNQRSIDVYVDSRNVDYNDKTDAKYIAYRVANLRMTIYSQIIGEREIESGTSHSMVSLLFDRTTNQTWLTTARHSIGTFEEGKYSDQ